MTVEVYLAQVSLTARAGGDEEGEVPTFDTDATRAIALQTHLIGDVNTRSHSLAF